MIDRVLQIIAPHHCYGCGKTGSLLCDNCKYDITSSSFSGCIVCGKVATSGICSSCQTHYTQAWCSGERSGELEALINGYKFERKKASYTVCASLLDAVVPQLPSSTVVVPVPTIALHIRQRGYDHTALVAKQFARTRQLAYTPVLARERSTVQFGASRKVRLTQAKQAFGVKQAVANVPHLLVDDVVTTGATLQYAAKQLLDAGASDVWVAVVARQPLDKRKV